MLTTPPSSRARYPNVTTYAAAMEPWVVALRQLVPRARIALCGGQDVAWNEALLAAPVAEQVAAVTRHVYTRLPEGPYATGNATAFLTVTSQAAVAGMDVGRQIAATLPPTTELWLTEIGFFGAAFSQGTWLKALAAVRQLMLLAAIAQTRILLPYCLVCHDPMQPSFTTPLGPYPPARNSTFTPGPWRYTPTGFAQALLFQGLADTSAFAPLNLSASAAVQAAHFDNLCVVYGCGAAGPALPGSGAVVASAAACAARCLAQPDCAYWQFMADSDSKCWLKAKDTGSISSSSSVCGLRQCNR